MKKQKLFIHHFCGHSITYSIIMAEPQECREITKMFYKWNKYHLRNIKFLSKKNSFIFFLMIHNLPYTVRQRIEIAWSFNEQTHSEELETFSSSYPLTSEAGWPVEIKLLTKLREPHSPKVLLSSRRNHMQFSEYTYSSRALPFSCVIITTDSAFFSLCICN